MLISLQHEGVGYKCDLLKPIDISIPVGRVKCFHAPDLVLSPVVSGEFIGDVNEGSPVNFYNVTMNPHGNGTHTESLGHITSDRESVNQCLKHFHFIALLVSVELEGYTSDDKVISREKLQKNCPHHLPEALIIRTLPNPKEKIQADYSGKNPAYLSKEAMEFIISNNVRHLLIDLPSVDREEDGGKVVNHKLFWHVLDKKADDKSRFDNTISELIYVPDHVKDGLYLLNIQIPSIDLDAVPSKPVLYELTKV